ncbi:MAG: hypothetical protein M1838_001440 [Thelocarpon superellum]|nr:MAG: hypothetical protein M1838_001440 [Thelocarpon superellum]
MVAMEELKKRRREDYGFHLEYRTRWYDSIVNSYLLQHCGLQPATSAQIGLVVHSSSTYFAPVGFPAVLELGLRVRKLGTSSVMYEIGVFEKHPSSVGVMEKNEVESGNGVSEQAVQPVKAVGEFVHVFVNRNSNRPAAQGMEVDLRVGLAKLLAKPSLSL